jgi:diadenosine tetraphosphate (Ap4A) HIT family hydrolase
MVEKYQNIIDERVDLANKGENKTAIIKMNSGWAVLGDNQIIPGYCLLLADPLVENINILEKTKRQQFLIDMTIIGDALINILHAKIINYSLLGNEDNSLHVHIHPRYEWEKEEYKKYPPWKYNFMKEPTVAFNYERDKELIKKLKKEIERLQA